MEKLLALTGEDLVGCPSRGLVIWDPTVEWCTVVRNQQVCLEVPGLDADAAKPKRCEFLMKALRDTCSFSVSVPPDRRSSWDTLPRTAYFDALYKLNPAPALYGTGDPQPRAADIPRCLPTCIPLGIRSRRSCLSFEGAYTEETLERRSFLRIDSY